MVEVDDEIVEKVVVDIVAVIVAVDGLDVDFVVDSEYFQLT
jgi:hypothetical protein